MTMKIISILNQKGGVAKTTTAINLSYELSLKKYKVLLVDIDQQGNASLGLGMNNTRYAVHNIISEENIPTKDIISKTNFDNLDIIPSNSKLIEAEINLAFKEKDNYVVLKNKLKEVEDDYDYVIIDCPPSLGIMSINALIASNSIIIPLQTEFYALEGLRELMNTIKKVSRFNKDLYIEGVLATLVDVKTKLSKDVINGIKDTFKDKVYDTVIPRNVKVAEAPSFGVPVFVHSEKSAGSIAYSNFAKEFLEKEGR